MIYTVPFSLLLLCFVCLCHAQTISESNSTSITATESISSSITASLTSTTTPFPATPTSSSSVRMTGSMTETISDSKSILYTLPPSFTPTYSNINPVPTIQTTGWDSQGNNDNGNQQSWLRQHNRFVFVIFLGLLFLAIVIWYIVRSIKGMRKRLERENQEQLYMMQQASGGARQPPPQQRNNIPELTETPPPAYKTEENTPVNPHH